MKKKRILIPTVIIFSIGGIIYSAFFRETDFISILYALIPGFIIILSSLLSKGDIGFGDGLMVLASALYIDFEAILGGLSISLLLSSVFALVMIIRKRKRQISFPFVPFLFAGFGIYFLLS